MKLKIFLILIALVSSALLITSSSLASTGDTVLDGFGETGEAAGYPVNGNEPTNKFTTAFPIYFVGFAGIMSALAVILFLYSGWLWMTAQGNDEQIAKAKKIMVGAIIGIIIIIFARLIAELTFSILGQGFEEAKSQ